MASWLDNVPLQTVQHIIHLLYPQTQSWTFGEGGEENVDQRDNDIFRFFTWLTDDAQSLHVDCRHSLVVAYQPPWILSEQDIKEFSECRSVCSTARKE
jgi:hypothetical protein